jgi:hypothetical protein
MGGMLIEIERFLSSECSLLHSHLVPSFFYMNYSGRPSIFLDRSSFRNNCTFLSYSAHLPQRNNNFVRCTFLQTLFELAQSEILEPSVQPSVFSVLDDIVAFDITIKDKVVFVENASNGFPMQFIYHICFSPLAFVQFAPPCPEALFHLERMKTVSTHPIDPFIEFVERCSMIIHFRTTFLPNTVANVRMPISIPQ